MIHPTPILSPEILDLVKNNDVELIMEDHFPCCFVAFNSLSRLKKEFPSAKVPLSLTILVLSLIGRRSLKVS
jgi:hypothetical protein